MAPGVDSASNRNEYQEYFLGGKGGRRVRLITLPPSCAVVVKLEFFIDTNSFRSHYGPGIDSASNRNEYQEYFLGGKGGRRVRLITVPPSCAVVMKLEFFIDIKSFRSHYGPGVDSASNRNEYQDYFLGGKGGRRVRLTTLPPSCAVVMKLESFIDIKSFRSHYGPGVDSASNSNEYQQYFLGVKAAGA